MKRNKTLKILRNSNGCNHRISNFLSFIQCMSIQQFHSVKYISSYCLYFDIIYLIQQSSQFTKVLWSKTSRKHLINFKHVKHVKHAVLWGTPSTQFYKACQERYFIKYVRNVIYEAC